MTDHEEATELLSVVGRELRALKAMGDADLFAQEIFGFISQQAAEKSFKAWLCLLGQTYPLTHDLDDLLARIQATDPDAEQYADLVQLGPYAVRLRYDSLSAEEAPLDRPRVIGRVEELLGHVSALVQRAADAPDPDPEPEAP